MRLPFGWWVGFEWTHCNGESSRTEACVLARHPAASLTWTSAVYVRRRGGQTRAWGLGRWVASKGHGSAWISTPLGGVSVAWQPFMAREPARG